MTIKYTAPSGSFLNKSKDAVADVIRESADRYAGSNMSFLNEGFRDFVHNRTLFSDLVENFAEGFDAEMAEYFTILAENGRQTLLENATISNGVTPISSLNMPVLRVLLPRLSMLNTLRNRPVEVPNFTISTLVNYIVDKDGNKYKLPNEFRKVPGGIGRKEINVDVKDFDTKPSQTIYIFPTIGASKANRDYIDNDSIVQAYYTTKDQEGKDVVVSSDIYDTSTASRSNMVRLVNEAEKVDITFFTHIDNREGILKVSMVNEGSNLPKTLVLHFNGFLSNENNRQSNELILETENLEVKIGSGDNLVSSITFQTMQDLKAMYQIDGAIQLSDMLARTMAMKLDYETVDFYQDVINRNQTAKNAVAYEYKFDVRPNASWLGNPKEWVDELKRVIDFACTRMVEDFNLSNGRFVISGQQMSTRLITNTNWINVGSNGVSTVGGVSVDYEVGNFVTTTGSITVLASKHLPMDTLTITYIPNDANYATLDYFAYSYNIINDNSYRNPNQPNIPAILLNRRDKHVNVLPMIARIKILNNNADLEWQPRPVQA